MKILFIQPSDSHVDGSLKGGVWHSPPLGIASLASFLRENKHEPKIVDLAVKGGDPENICEKFKPDYVGFSITTPLLHEANRIAQQLKKKFPKIKIIFGGPHPSASINEILENHFVDFVVYGEGEYTLLELLNSRPVNEIKGLAYKENNTIRINPPRELIQDLDRLPMPAYDLLDISQYPNHPFSQRAPSLSMITSRGCPFECIYCNKSVFGKSFRKMSYNKVVDQIESLVKRYGIKEFNIVDDVFTLDKERVRNICQEIIRRKLDIKWMTPNGIRAGSLDLETLRIMKESGCHYLYLGIESGSARILERIKKGIMLDQVVDTVELINKVRIHVGAFFMLGLPDETEEDMRKTISLAKQLKLDSVKFGITVPLPGTEIFNEFKSKGFIKNFDYSVYFWHKEPVFETDLVSKETLFYYYKKAYREFYFRPKYVLRKIISLRSFSDFRNIFNGFKTMIRNQLLKSITNKLVKI